MSECPFAAFASDHDTWWPTCAKCSAARTSSILSPHTCCTKYSLHSRIPSWAPAICRCSRTACFKRTSHDAFMEGANVPPYIIRAGGRSDQIQNQVPVAKLPAPAPPAQPQPAQNVSLKTFAQNVICTQTLDNFYRP